MSEAIQAVVNQTWRTTSSRDEALANGYFGEVPLIPTRVANMVHLILYRRPLHAQMMYYYGIPDAELCKKFNIPAGWMPAEIAERMAEMQRQRMRQEGKKGKRRGTTH